MALCGAAGSDDGVGALGQPPPGRDGDPGTMTSFNHYALGAVAGWLHRVVGGAPDAVRARGDRVDPGR